MALITLVGMVLGLLHVGSTKPYAKYYLDMTHDFNSETVYWPLLQEPKFTLNVTEKVFPGKTKVQDRY